VPVLAATLKPTDPLPVPLAPAVIVIHGVVVVAVQAQLAGVVTATGVPAPAVAGTDWLVGAIVYEHEGGGGGAGAACETVKVCPAMVIVPVRAPPEFAATLNSTVPFPLPLAPDVTVTQEALLVAVHAQLLVVETATVLPALPAAAIDWLVGAMEYEHDGGGGGGGGGGAGGSTIVPVCVSVNVWPAMVSVSVRAPPAFGSTRNPTDALPLPLAPVVIEIHAALLTAVHAHPAGADTATDPPEPPSGGTVPLVGEIV
jgi:hypothetical protein